MNDAMWEVPVGIDADFEVTILDKFGEPVVFSGAEPLPAAWMWQGVDLTPIAFVLMVSWTGGSPPDGVCIASVSGAATAAMASDYYLTRIAVTLGSGRLYNAFDGWLNLQDSPGAGVAPVVYCTLQDLLDVGGDWLATLMTTTGRTSFLADRARAARQLDRAILSRSRPCSRGWSESMLTLQGFGPEQPDTYLAGLLAGGGLVQHPEIAEACAYLAAHYVCERVLTWDEGDAHRRRSVYSPWCKWRSLRRGVFELRRGYE